MSEIGQIRNSTSTVGDLWPFPNCETSAGSILASKAHSSCGIPAEPGPASSRHVRESGWAVDHRSTLMRQKCGRREVYVMITHRSATSARRSTFPGQPITAMCK
jgi:hypothetical protein